MKKTMKKSGLRGKHSQAQTDVVGWELTGRVLSSESRPG